MKTYHELTQEQQAAAVKAEVTKLLQAIVEGAIRFNDELNGDSLQAAIDAAIAEAEAMQTPWFTGEYIMDAQYKPCEGHVTGDNGLRPVADAIESMAVPVAEDALYLEAGEYAVYLEGLEQ